MSKWKGPFVFRIWDESGLVTPGARVIAVTRSDSLDLRPALRAHGTAVGTAFGTALDVWVEMADVAVMVYPLFPIERDDMDLVHRALAWSRPLVQDFTIDDRGVFNPLPKPEQNTGGRDPR